jgi:hypothetical protein
MRHHARRGHQGQYPVEWLKRKRPIIHRKQTPTSSFCPTTAATATGLFALNARLRALFMSHHFLVANRPHKTALSNRWSAQGSGGRELGIVLRPTRHPLSSYTGERAVTVTDANRYVSFPDPRATARCWLASLPHCIHHAIYLWQ